MQNNNKTMYYFHVYGTDYGDELPILDVFTTPSTRHKFNIFYLIDAFETKVYLDRHQKRKTHAFIASIVR